MPGMAYAGAAMSANVNRLSFYIWSMETVCDFLFFFLVPGIICKERRDALIFGYNNGVYQQKYKTSGTKRWGSVFFFGLLGQWL